MGESQLLPLWSNWLGVMSLVVSRGSRLGVVGGHGVHRMALSRLLLLSYCNTGKKGGVQRVHVGIENGGVKVPDHNRQRGQQSLVEMNRGGDVEPTLRQQSQDQIVRP